MGNRSDRAHAREYIVLPAIVAAQGVPDAAPMHVGLNDVSVSGARIRADWSFPESTPILLTVETIRFNALAFVIRTFKHSGAWDIALKFFEPHPEIPQKLLEYKLRRRPGAFR